MAEIKHMYHIEKPVIEQHETKKIKNKKILDIGQILLLIVIIAVFAIQVINFYSLKAETNENFSEKISSTDTNPNSALAEQNRNIIFILGVYDGKLAVMDSEKNKIYEVFDVYINTLPEYDKNLLSAGIEIKNVNDLYSLIEDYSS